MGQKALLIGQSTYVFLDNKPFSAAGVWKNLQAVEAVLRSDVAQFSEGDIEILVDADAQQLRQAIEHFGAHCSHDDLRLLYFCGLGLIDDRTGKSYIATCDTQPHNLSTTAVSDDFMRGVLGKCHSHRQLLCVDSGLPLLMEGEMARDIHPYANGHNADFFSHIASDHRAILTGVNLFDGSSRRSTEVSCFTHHLVEGIESGLADLGADGYISVLDIYQYLQLQIHEEDWNGKISLYAPETSADIRLFKLPQYQPEVEYRRGVEEYVAAEGGMIGAQGRSVLDFLRHNLGLTLEVSEKIEAEVLRPYQERQARLQQYEAAFREAIELENPPGRSLRRWLKHLQQNLSLSFEDTAEIEARMAVGGVATLSQSLPASQTTEIEQVALVSDVALKNGWKHPDHF